VKACTVIGCISAESLEPPERLRLIEEIFRTEENYLDSLKLVFEVSQTLGAVS
jgi:hypothetical protein